MNNNGPRIRRAPTKQLKPRWLSKSKILNQWSSRQRRGEGKEVVAESTRPVGEYDLNETNKSLLEVNILLKYLDSKLLKSQK